MLGAAVVFRGEDDVFPGLHAQAVNGPGEHGGLHHEDLRVILLDGVYHLAGVAHALPGEVGGVHADEGHVVAALGIAGVVLRLVLVVDVRVEGSQLLGQVVAYGPEADDKNLAHNFISCFLFTLVLSRTWEAW